VLEIIKSTKKEGLIFFNKLTKILKRLVDQLQKVIDLRVNLQNQNKVVKILAIVTCKLLYIRIMVMKIVQPSFIK